MSLPPDQIGSVLGGRYRIDAVLGTGASAIVFRAEDTTLERPVAVKLLRPALATDEAFLKRFRAEARSVAALNHPNILQVYDWGEEDGVPYLVTELLAGGSLKDLLDAGVRLTVEQAVLVGGHAAAGLAYAHARGLVHRDVKPANLLFDDEGRLRITDFGVARALAEASWTEPVGAMIGTVRYASPEQAEGLAVDGKSDVYSLSLVLYEAVTGIVPFVADTPVATLRGRVGQTLPQAEILGPLDPVLVQAAFPDHTARLDAQGLEQRLASLASMLPAPAPLPVVVDGRVVRSSSEGSPTDRFRAPTVDELTQAVPVVGATGPVPAGVVAPFDHLADDGTIVDHLPPDGGGGRRRRRRWPWLVLTVVLLGGAFAAVAVATKLFVPSVSVPKLVGTTTATAQRVLDHEHLNAAFQPSVYSVTVPAGHIIVQQPAPGTSVKQGSTIRLVASRGLPPVTVPSLAGMTCQQAKAALSAAHLVGKCPGTLDHYSPTVPVGQVVRYLVGTAVNPPQATYGSTVDVVISKGPAPVAVPAVSGSFAQAEATLVAAGFKATEAKEASSSVPAGQVTRTDPVAGTKVQKGTTVTVYVSTGPALVVVPSLDGKTVAEATAKLARLGLQVGAVYGPPSGTVFRTNPAVGASVKVGSVVNLWVQ
jgi:serine/threonine-protein kinase